MVGGTCSLLPYGTGICHDAFIYPFFCPYLFPFFKNLYGIGTLDGTVDDTSMLRAYTHGVCVCVCVCVSECVFLCALLTWAILKGLALQKFEFHVCVRMFCFTFVCKLIVFCGLT